MTSSLEFPFTSCNVTSADRDLPRLLRVSGPEPYIHDQAVGYYPKEGCSPEIIPKTSCLALSEQDALRFFLGECLPVDNYFCLPHVCEVLDPLSGGISVGRLCRDD
jgi:hypothetical protein